MQNNRKRKQKSSPVLVVGCIFLMVGIGIFCYKLFGYWWSDLRYNKMESQYAPVHTAEVAQGAGQGAAAEQPTVDFESLRADCPNAVAWLTMESIGISYPVVQAVDNEYYLKHAADNSSDAAGAIFLDSSNRSDFTDAHTLVYGHHMQNGSMFGKLYKFGQEDFYRDGNSRFLIYTPTEVQEYEIFSMQTVRDTDSIYTTGFTYGSALDIFANNLVALSIVQTGVPVSGEDQIVTLSTCTTAGNEDRFVVSAKRVR